MLSFSLKVLLDIYIYKETEQKKKTAMGFKN